LKLPSLKQPPPSSPIEPAIAGTVTAFTGIADAASLDRGHPRADFHRTTHTVVADTLVTPYGRRRRRQEPASFEVTLALANTLRELRELTRARDLYATALEMRPGSAESVGRLRTLSAQLLNLCTQLPTLCAQLFTLCTGVDPVCTAVELVCTAVDRRWR
jgi:hypothetical protein